MRWPQDIYLLHDARFTTDELFGLLHLQILYRAVTLIAKFLRHGSLQKLAE